MNTQRLTGVSGTGPEAGSYSHDATGNQTSDPSGSYTYSPFNMLQTATVGGQTTTYVYDGDNVRMRTEDASGNTPMIRGMNGQLLSEFHLSYTTWEYGWTRDSIYLGSRLLATVRPNGQGVIVEYAHADVLGSVRATTDQSGTTLARHDYFAFGEDAGPGPATGPERQRFTGKERDSETFFDYFNARYYRNVIGRFTTSDPAHANASLARPQSWNAYAYASNNPLRFVDPTGMSDEDGTTYLAASGSSSMESGSFDDWVDFYYNASVDHDYDTWVLLGRPSVAAEERAAQASAATQTAAETPNLTCVGQARVLGGNPDTIGRQGGIPRQTVQANSAAMIPAQFGLPDRGSALGPYAGAIFGTVGNLNVSFTGVTDVIGGRSPIPNVPVRQALQQLNPGLLIIELPSGRDMGVVPVTIHVPRAIGCPTGTRPSGG